MRNMPSVRDCRLFVPFALAAFLLIVRFEFRIVPLRNRSGDVKRAAQIRRAALRDCGIPRERLSTLFHFRIESRVRNELLSSSKSKRVANLRDNDCRKFFPDTDDTISEGAFVVRNESRAFFVKFLRGASERIFGLDKSDP